MFSVGSKSLNSRGFWKMAKNKKKSCAKLSGFLPISCIMTWCQERGSGGSSNNKNHHSSSILDHPFIPFNFASPSTSRLSLFSRLFALNSWGVKMFFLSAESKSSSRRHQKLPKKDKSISCQIMENLHSYGVFQSCQKGISKINITRTSNVGFWHFRMPEKVGMFFLGGWMEGATRHSLRKNSLEKVTRRVAVDGKAQLLEAPSSRKNRSYVPGIKIGKQPTL